MPKTKRTDDDTQVSADRGRRTRASAAPTIGDVAIAAGVSPMTVSRVINSENGVLPTNRDRVVRAIATLGYVPNPSARSLAGRHQPRIAALFNNPSSSYLCEFLIGSFSGAAQSDAQVVIEQWSDSETEEALARRLVSRRIDAVSLPPPLCEHARLLAALANANILVARIAASDPASTIVSVSMDDFGAAHAMTRYLIDLGHRRVGFVTGSADQSASALRLSGYRRALQEAGLLDDPQVVAEGDFTYQSGLLAGTRLLGLDVPPSAILRRMTTWRLPSWQ